MATGETWKDQIARRLPPSGQRAAVARAAGIHPNNLRRYLATGGGLSAASIERLAAAVGLRLAEEGQDVATVRADMPHQDDVATPTQTVKPPDQPDVACARRQYEPPAVPARPKHDKEADRRRLKPQEFRRREREGWYG